MGRANRRTGGLPGRHAGHLGHRDHRPARDRNADRHTVRPANPRIPPRRSTGGCVGRRMAQAPRHDRRKPRTHRSPGVHPNRLRVLLAGSHPPHGRRGGPGSVHRLLRRRLSVLRSHDRLEALYRGSQRATRGVLSGRTRGWPRTWRMASRCYRPSPDVPADGVHLRLLHMGDLAHPHTRASSSPTPMHPFALRSSRGSLSYAGNASSSHSSPASRAPHSPERAFKSSCPSSCYAPSG